MPTETVARQHARRERRRMTADQVRRKMLEAGRSLARQIGLGASLEEISMEEVIRRARVPRSSVYRIWPYKSDFAADLLIYLAGPSGYLSGGDVFDAATFEVARKTIAMYRHCLISPQGRRAVLCEVVRRAVNANFTHMLEDPTWGLHHALLATLGSIKDRAAKAAVAAALEEAEAVSRANISGLVQEIMAAVGLRLRDPRAKIEHLVIAGSSLLDTLALRHALTADMTAGTDRGGAYGRSETSGSLVRTILPGPDTPDGTPAEWSLPALSYLALVDAFTELDPDFEAPEEPAPAGR